MMQYIYAYNNNNEKNMSFKESKEGYMESLEGRK